MNIGINIQEKMKKISKQAKETFDYAKMELKIKTYGRECKKRYSKIGSLVYECRKKGSAVNGEEIENLCREIDKYKHRIKVIQRQIDELKADDIQDNPEVVEDYTLEKKDNDLTMSRTENGIQFLKFCPDCNVGNEPDADVCAKCGHKFKKN